MATTTTGARSRPGTRKAGPASGRAAGARREGRAATGGQGDERYDLLTAALIGAAVGATATLLLRSGSRMRPSGSALAKMALVTGGEMAARAGAGMLSRKAARSGMRAAGPALEAATDHVHRYVRSARSAIDDAVAAEVRALRRAIRKQRRKVGL